MDLDRRKVLGTVGGLAIAGSGLAAFSGSAAASVNTYFQAHGTSVLRNDDGSVQNVNVDVDGEYSWDNLDSPANMATVSLKAKVPGKTTKKTAHSETQTANGTHGSGTFSFDNVDLTETFNDAVFEDDTDDGSKKVTDVKLWIVVSINYGNNNSVGNSASDTMGVQVNNLASKANVNGESWASASSYDQQFVSHDGDAMLYISHDENSYTFHLDVRAWKDTSAQGFNDSADNWVFAVNLDESADDRANFQVARRPDGTVKFSGTTSSGWNKDTNAGWKDLSNVNGVSATATDDGTLTVTVDASYFGSTYSVMCHASAGGEYPSTVISNTAGSAWSSGFDAEDEYYLGVDPSQS